MESRKRFALESTARYARAYIHSSNLPDTVDELLDYVDRDYDAFTKVEQVSDGLYRDDFFWTAPQWALPGDVIFFHYAARATARVGTLRKALKSEGIVDAAVDTFLDRAAEDASRFAGTVFAVGVLTAPAAPRGESDYDPHWHSRLEAPINVVATFDVPLLLRDHTDVLSQPHKPLLPLTSGQFSAVKSRLIEIGNVLPEEIDLAVPGRDDFAGISDTNWRQFACAEDAIFWDETDLRDYFADYLLNEIKDPGTDLFHEVRCLRSEGRGRVLRGTARADYVLSIGRRLIPVETKVSLIACPQIKLLSQIDQYASADVFEASARTGKVRLPRLTEAPSTQELTPCILIDQRGIYVVGESGFVGDGPEQPLISRDSILRLRKAELRRLIRSFIR